MANNVTPELPVQNAEAKSGIQETGDICRVVCLIRGDVELPTTLNVVRRTGEGDPGTVFEQCEVWKVV